MKDYTRVTTVLEPFSGLKHIDPEILKKAGERGTAVHSICDAIISDMGSPIHDERLSGYIESFKSWKGDKKFLDKPERFYCDDLMLTGECDAIYEENGKHILVDFKTSVKENQTWGLQGSAYFYLANKAGYNIHRIEFVKLCKQGGEATIFLYEQNFKLFRACLDVYRHFFKDKKEENVLDYL